MPSRIFDLIWLVLAVWFVAGCQSNRLPADASNDSTEITGGALTADYSARATKNRVEAHARYANAILLELDEDSEGAAEEFIKAAQADVSNEELVIDISRRLLHQKKLEQALTLLQEATAVPSASGTLYARLGLIHSLLGHKEEAISANLTAIKKMPRSLVGYQHLAQLYLQAGQPEEGLKILDQAARQNDVTTGFLLELSDLYLAFARASKTESEQFKTNALAILNRAAAAPRKTPAQEQDLADSYALFGDTERAIKLYDDLLQRYPQRPGLKEKLTDLYLRTKDRTQAARLLEQLVRDNPTNPQAYYFLGGIAFDERDPKKAASYYEKTILLSPNFQQAYYDLAGAQINLKDPRKALETLQRAKEKFQQTFVGEYFTALAYSGLKDYSNAINHLIAAEVIARATETNRLNHAFYFQLGSVYERNKQYDEAEKYFRMALAASPDFSEAMNYLGYMWAERGVNLTEARSMIEKAIKLEPENPAYLDSLAWVLYRLKKPEEGLEHLLKAIAHSEEPDPTLFDHLGDIYLTLNQPEKAREAWRKALAVEPNLEIQKKLDADR